MIKLYLKICIFLSINLSLLFFLFSPHEVLAQTTAATPNLQLEIPIFGYTTASNIAEYIKNLYQYALYVLVPIAIVIIIAAGIMWILAGGDQARIKQAKKYISGAVIGIMIGLLSYVILSFMGITELRVPDVTYIEAIPLEDGSTAIDDKLPAAQQPGNVSSKGQECFLNTYGSSSSAVQANLISLNFAGKSVKVHKLALTGFQAASQKITVAGLKAKSSTGTFAWRSNRNNPSSLSLHSFGIAIDIEWQKNGNCHPKDADQTLYDQLKVKYSGDIAQLCAHATEFHCSCSHDPRLIRALVSSGFRWGAYKNTFDSMHFEWTGLCFNKK